MSYENLNKAIAVGSKNQLLPNKYVRFENENGTGLRVLFIGNSITVHGPKADIGWFGDYGMAASSKDKDYVHLIEEYILKNNKDSAFCICNVSDWEREYKNCKEQLEKYLNAREFGANIIIFKVSANSPCRDFDEDIYYESFNELVTYINKTKRAKILISSDFFKHPAEECMKKYAENNGYAYCKISDLEEINDMRAIGLFENDGVAGHPSDKGMKTIAQRMIKQLSTNNFL